MRKYVKATRHFAACEVDEPLSRSAIKRDTRLSAQMNAHKEEGLPENGEPLIGYLR